MSMGAGAELSRVYRAARLKLFSSPNQVLTHVAWGPQALLLIGGKRREEPRSPVNARCARTSLFSCFASSWLGELRARRPSTGCAAPFYYTTFNNKAWCPCPQASYRAARLLSTFPSDQQQSLGSPGNRQDNREITGVPNVV